MSLSLADQSRACQELAELLRLGYPLVEAVGRVRAAAPPALGRALETVEAQLLEGASLGQALERQGSFALPLVRGIQAGEAAENPAEALEQVSALLEEEQHRRLGIRLALAYPRLALTVVAVLLWVVVAGALQGFMTGGGLVAIFEDMNLQLPLPTRILLAFTRLFPPAASLVLLVAFVAAWQVILSGSLGTDRLRQALPFLGGWLRRQDSVIWLLWMDYLLGRGVPLPQATDIAAQAAQTPTFRQRMQAVAARLARGEALSQALAGSGTLPEEGCWLVARAEQAGFHPPGCLARAAHILRLELELSYRRGLGALEPLAVVALGLLIGFVVLACFLPLYQLMGNMG
ncbi:MAG TPA: type II secretion system F family protein [Candidatus Nitrosotenuis sp.]|jgi:type II secretory pathway component PulF|nr:type II secretion system F family protein [Candidatus Nitrosotenuis sp.]